VLGAPQRKTGGGSAHQLVDTKGEFMRSLVTVVLIMGSIVCIAYNLPYLWYVEYRHIGRALDSPVDGPLNMMYLETTAATYESFCFKDVGHQLRNWNTTRGAVPAGELNTPNDPIRCVVTWKPNTAMPTPDSAGRVAGLLYHPGYLERRSVPELGQAYPPVILRVGTVEQLREFHSARNRFRILSSVILGIFAVGGVVKLTKKLRGTATG